MRKPARPRPHPVATRRPAAKTRRPDAKTRRPAPARRPAPQEAPPRKAPRAGLAAAPEGRPDSGRPRALAAARAGLDKKAEDVLLLDVRGLVSYADYFVVMSATSEPQAAAIADEVGERLEALGARQLGVEGRSGGRWVLLDHGDVVTHVLSPETRRFYDLEGLWADAPRFRVEG